MKVLVTSIFHSAIEYDSDKVSVVGPLSLLNKMNELKNSQGSDPKKWKQIENLKSDDDILIHDFICKVHSQPSLPYHHAELCHCRMVPTEKVHQAIKQGCRDVKEVARTTLAGTGCGACRKDTETILTSLGFMTEKTTAS